MVINRKAIVIEGNSYHNKYFTNLNLVITYSKY
jgi:hypothetical protein